jgi:signal transduction histidine kinase
MVAAISNGTTALVAAAVLAIATGGQLVADAISDANVAQPVSQVFLYLASGFISRWAVTTLRRSDEAIRSTRDELSRSEERSRISAHLHDSVLQTLALVQKAADRPGDVVALARRQERELRGWLHGESDSEGSVAEALRRAAADVEERYGTQIEVVAVGDSTSRDLVDLLVPAARECMVNAAKHSGADVVSVFAECRTDRVEIFVRDRGIGFVPDTVPQDRRGITDSVKARLARLGGTAELRTDVGRGTEWKLEVTDG